MTVETEDEETTAPEVPAETPRPTLWAAAGGWWGAGVALVLLALTRVAQLALVYLMAKPAPDGGVMVRDRLLIWDAEYFIKLAVHGYPDVVTITPTGVPAGAEYAFFPLYPMLIRVIVLLGVEQSTAAIAASWLASAGAAVALHLLGTSLFNRKAGFAFVVICCAAPMSIVLSMAYSESLFLAMVAAMLVAAHRRSWFFAGAFGLGAALTRPTGAAAAVALGVAALLAVRDARRNGTGGTWQPLLAAAVALSGVPAYLAWVGWRTGAWDTWFQIQSIGWGTKFDYGYLVWGFLKGALLAGEGWVPVSMALLLIAALASAVVAVAGRAWPPLAVYGLLAMVLVYGQAGYYHSKPRLLFPVLVTLIPGVKAAARARPQVLVPALVAWSAFGLWYGAYMVTVWPYTL